MTTNTELNKRQKHLFIFIHRYIRQHGYSPSVNEMSKGMDMAHTTVHNALKKMEAAGLITRVPHKNRTIKIVREVTK